MLSRVLRRTVYFGVPALAGWYAFIITKELAPTRKAIIQTKLSPSSSLADSYAIRKVVNPHDFSSKGDSRSTTINVPSDVSDEQLLAWFLKGFFGSHIFALEALALRAFGGSGPQFDILQHVPSTNNIWYAAQISGQKLPVLHSVLFGAFRIVDIDLVRNSSLNDQQSETERFVDVAFRPDIGNFAGCHRFAISTTRETDGTSRAYMKLSCYVCNVERGQKPFGDGIAGRFHLLYANVLFRAGIANVLRQLEKFPR